MFAEMSGRGPRVRPADGTSAIRERLARYVEAPGARSSPIWFPDATADARTPDD